MARKLLICCAVLLPVQIATVLPLCGVIFQCGCTLRGGARHCNIHELGVPHCPWCSHGMAYLVGSFAIILAGTSGTSYAAMRLVRPTIPTGVLAGIAGYAVSASAVGLAAALADGYPVWYGFHL